MDRRSLQRGAILDEVAPNDENVDKVTIEAKKIHFGVGKPASILSILLTLQCRGQHGSICALEPSVHQNQNSMGKIWSYPRNEDLRAPRRHWS